MTEKNPKKSASTLNQEKPWHVIFSLSSLGTESKSLIKGFDSQGDAEEDAAKRNIRAKELHITAKYTCVKNPTA